MIDGAPEIAEFAVDLHERLIQVPTAPGILAHDGHPLLSDLGSEQGQTGSTRTGPSWLMSIPPSAKRSSTLRNDSGDQTDHFRRAIEISERVAHGLKLPDPRRSEKIGMTMPFALRDMLHSSRASLAAPT